MATIDWNTAATAVFVTLAIEYVAKPRLEARKERFLDALRTRRELLTAITKLTAAAGKFGARLPNTADPKLQQIWKAERDRHYDIMRQQALDLSDDVDRYAQAYPRQMYGVLMPYVFCVHGIVLSRRSRDRQAELIAALGEPVATVMEARLWRIRAWIRAQEKVRRMIADIEAASEPTPTA